MGDLSRRTCSCDLLLTRRPGGFLMRSCLPSVLEIFRTLPSIMCYVNGQIGPIVLCLIDIYGRWLTGNIPIRDDLSMLSCDCYLFVYDLSSAAGIITTTLRRTVMDITLVVALVCLMMTSMTRNII